MKKRILFISLFIISCKSINNINKAKENWINAYKSTVFISCLNQSFGEKFDTLLKSEQSIMANFEVLEYANTKIADSLGRNFALKILTPPKNSDFYGKKVIINNCLHLYRSKELDSIANSEYEKMLKNQ
nr:hypothetical protein [uncultured Flavobacterium sp.]